MNRNLLTVSEVSKFLNISRCYVFKLIKSGQMPAVRIGKLLRVSQTDLQRFIKNHRTEVQNGRQN